VNTDLTERLKQETWSLHTRLERSTLMRSLLRGEMDRAGYCALLRNLHVVYSTLEPALERHSRHPGIAPVCFPEVFRSEALADDLRVLHGDDWRDAVAVQPSAHRYTERLGQLADGSAELLVAHAYVRYLGDLSGGQVLRRIVATSLQLPAGQGTRFYDFGEPADVNRLRQAFREGLGRVTQDTRQVDRLVAEATWSFQLHQALFDELADAADLPRAAADVSAGN